MIHQCYFHDSQRARLFASPLYRGFGLYTAVNPVISQNCPELEDPKTQPLLSEYAAMLHLWRNPDLDDDPWIGFTSYRQLDKSPVILENRRDLEIALARFDVIGWGFFTFVNATSGRPISLADQGEWHHAGITSALWQLLSRRGEPMPLEYLTGNRGLFCNYWVMSKQNFNDFMNWSYGMIRRCLEQQDSYTRSHFRSLAYLAERLFICWYTLRNKRLLNVGPVAQVACPRPHIVTGIGAQSFAETHQTLPSWNTSLLELCQHWRLRPRGIVHVGAHYAEEREIYHCLGASRVLWIEADPAHLGRLRTNIAGYPGFQAVQACLADIDGNEVDFFQTDNRGESSSILPMSLHQERFPDIHVVSQIKLRTTTFSCLAMREGIDVRQFDFLVLDVQGAELLVLRGFGEHLYRLNAVYVEVNVLELYKGCVLLQELDAFLQRFGFRRRETLMTTKDYGDALYLREGVVDEPPATLLKHVGRARAELTTQQWFKQSATASADRVFEFREDGTIGHGELPSARAWQVRATGHDIVLEVIGDQGRSAVLWPGNHREWYGASLVKPNTAINLCPVGLNSGEL